MELLDFVAEGATMNALQMDAGDFTNFNGKVAANLFIGIQGDRVSNFGTLSDSTGADIVNGLYLARTDTVDSVQLQLVAVPEPTSCVLLGFGGLALLSRRKRSASKK